MASGIHVSRRKLICEEYRRASLAKCIKKRNAMISKTQDPKEKKALQHINCQKKNEEQSAKAEVSKTGTQDENYNNIADVNSKELQYIQDIIMPKILNHDFADTFKSSNELKQQLNLLYGKDITEQPISLNTIKKRLERKKYQTAMECIQDYDLMFGNVLQTELIEQVLYVQAKELKNIFNDELKMMASEISSRHMKQMEEKKRLSKSRYLEELHTILFKYRINKKRNTEREKLSENINCQNKKEEQSAKAEVSKTGTQDENCNNNVDLNSKELQYIKDIIMPKILNHDFADSFKCSNELKEHLNLLYGKDITEQPISLNTIKKRLERNKYQTAMECIQDYDVMFDKVLQTELIEQVLYVEAKELKKIFDDELKMMASKISSLYMKQLEERYHSSSELTTNVMFFEKEIKGF